MEIEFHHHDETQFFCVYMVFVISKVRYCYLSLRRGTSTSYLYLKFRYIAGSPRHGRYRDIFKFRHL